MKVKDIVSSHITAPFTMPNNARSSCEFSTTEKVALAALSILIGVFTLGIGGVIFFYLTTAAMKALKPNYIQHTPPATLPLVTSPEIAVTKDSQITEEKVNGSGKGELNSVAAQIQSPTSLQQELHTSYPTSIQNRRYPPFSAFDTRSGIDKFGQPIKGQPDVNFFNEDDILTLHPSIHTIDLHNNIKADVTDNGRIVIQQQAQRSWAAATTAMLIYDAHKPIDNITLIHNLADTQLVKLAIEKAGLTPLLTKLIVDNGDGILIYTRELMESEIQKLKMTRLITHNAQLMAELGRLIQDHGPAIVFCEGRSCIVDEVSNDLCSIRLREPYHGWALTVKAEAFLKGFRGGNIVQILKA